jgi:hypothetical protein
VTAITEMSNIFQKERSEDKLELFLAELLHGSSGSTVTQCRRHSSNLCSADSVEIQKVPIFEQEQQPILF